MLAGDSPLSPPNSLIDLYSNEYFMGIARRPAAPSSRLGLQAGKELTSGFPTPLGLFLVQLATQSVAPAVFQVKQAHRLSHRRRILSQEDTSRLSMDFGLQSPLPFLVVLVEFPSIDRYAQFCYNTAY